MTQAEQKKIIDTLYKYKEFGIDYLKPLSLDKDNININELPNCNSKLEEYIEHCNLCDLSKVCHDKKSSIGDSASDLYFINTNIDFFNINKFNRLANIIEKILMLNINCVYITNIIKCNYTIKNRSLEQYIENCKDYVLKQIAINQPKCIITFGDAFNYLMETKTNITDVSGNLFEYNKTILIPLMDLEFINKNPSYNDKMSDDLKKVKKILEN